MQATRPLRLEIVAKRRAPRVPNRRFRQRVHISQQQRNDVMNGADVVEGGNRGLDDSGRSIDRASIAPTLQRMRQWQMPFAKRPCLVPMDAEMDRGFDLRDSVPESQPRRRSIGRVGVNDDKRFYSAAANVAHQIAQPLGVRDIGGRRRSAEQRIRAEHLVSSRHPGRCRVVAEAATGHERSATRGPARMDCAIEPSLLLRRKIRFCRAGNAI
ncbi:hypothetical protein ABIE91_001085 [Bradyrhizobium elkanii]